MNLSEISYLCGGRLKAEGRLEIEKFVIDSRRAEKNSLFFCIKGEKVDGHDFMGEAKSRGAYVVGEKGNCDIIVDSSVDALIKAASRYRRKINARVIGITGSAGKTSTVSLVKSVLSNKYRVCSTPASFNTRIGVSIALLNFTEKCQMAVVEMGANSRGEIKEICEIALPQTGLITNISDAHIGVFGSRENIIKAKFELADAIPQKGCFIYNSDDDNLYQKAKSYKIPKMSFSLDSEADIKGRIISRTQEGIAFKCQGQVFKIKVPGIFNVYNALAAICVGILLNVDMKKIKRGIEGFVPPPHRMNIREIKGIKIIDDCYNASPSSVKALFSEMLKIYPQKDIIAVVGEMLELGKYSKKLHRETGEFLAKLSNIKYILAGGSYCSQLMDGAGASGFDREKLIKFSSVAQAAGIIKEIVNENSIVVLKASRLMKLEDILELL